MTVIALAMETGTFDRTFAARLAEGLELTLVDMTRLEREVAERNNFGDSIIHRLIRQCRLGAKCQDTYQSPAARICEETLAAAARGDVVVHGWCASALLRSVGHAVRVRIGASMACRERNVRLQCSFNSLSTARLEIASADALVARLVTRVLHVDWRDPSLYHLVLNVDGLTDEACARLIGDLAKATPLQERASRPEALTSLLTKQRRGGDYKTGDGLGLKGAAVVECHEFKLTCRDTHEDAIAKAERSLRGERCVIRQLPPSPFEHG